MSLTSNDDGRVPVEILAEEYLVRRASGDPVTIHEYVSRHPDLADDIREVFPALEALKSLSTEWKRTVVDPHQAGPKLPFQLGDYRLERQIGRGGMGIVYEAEHTSLRRRVAVKLLRLFSLNTDSDIRRFHKEAQSAARLHHTNIVPVFDFGDAEGYHYIAMQLIQGDGLDVIVDRLRLSPEEHSKGKQTDTNQDALPTLVYDAPEYWRHVAGIGIQAANALEYAHSQGTVHRDIKPANLLLDANGIVWVADFGLARQDEDGKPTQTGILSGTLRYLAPEHFHGQCDERTDQYGLGLSLYELTTLQSVIADNASHAEIMRRITEAKVVSPRRLNANIPQDLETIILKAIAANPANRFRSCKELADDLKRFADGRPIHSRPISGFERLWRWSKRFPALAIATATSAALLALVALVATLGYRAEYEQRQRAETTSEYALEALDTVFDRYALNSQAAFVDETTVSTPVLSQEAAVMLDGLLPIFDRLADLGDQSDGVRQRATVARRRVGDIQQRLGQFEAAIASYRQAAHRYRTTTYLNSAERALRLSGIYNNIGICEIMLGRTEDSRASHEIALEHLNSLTEHTTEVMYERARTLFLMTKRLRPGEGPNEVNNGRRPRNPPPRHGGPPGGEGPRRLPPKERLHLDDAITLIESLDDTKKEIPRFRHLLAMCLKACVPDQFSGRSVEDQSFENRALSILKQLAIDYPGVSEYRHGYVDVLAGLDTKHVDSFDLEDLPDAESRLRLAIQHGEDLVAIHPYVPDYTITLIHAHNKLAHVLEHRAMLSPSLQANSFLKDAMEAYLSAAKLQSSLAKRFPEAGAYETWQQEFEWAAGRVRDKLDGR